MDLKIKKLFELTGSPLCLDPNMTYPSEYETNFLTEYDTNKAQYDRYFIKEHGDKLVEVDGDIDADIILNWKLEIQAIQRVYLNSWARIWDTLNIAYNPVYNVEEHITTEYGKHETEREYGQHETDREYGQHETDVEYGQHETTTEFGNTSDTLGTHTDTATTYSVSYDDGVEKETGKTSDVIGSQTNTSTAHTDTETSKLHKDTTTSKLHTDKETSKLHTDKETSKLHTDTVERTGNIGIKSATALADEEIFFREKQIFFKNIFLTISREIGAYYDNHLI